MQRIGVEDEDALQRLDRLAQEEAWMTTTELLGIAHRIDDRVNGVDSRVECVYNKVQGIGKKGSRCRQIVKVQGVDDKVHDDGHRVQAQILST